MAYCIKQVLDECSVAQCAMIGHSMGGYVALAFAENYPEMITGLGLFHSSALADSEAAKSARDAVIRAVRNDHLSFITSFIPELFAPANREIFAAEINELIVAARQMSSEAVIAALAGMRDRPDRTHLLRNAPYPVLFILGKQDTRVEYKKALEQASLPDDAVILSLGDVAHMGYIEAREKTIYAVSAFLEGL
jgi:pimeloyl-ACP methyl ester carboxylesterase